MVSIYIAQPLHKKKSLNKKLLTKHAFSNFICKIYFYFLFFPAKVACKANATLELNVKDTNLITAQKVGFHVGTCRKMRQLECYPNSSSLHMI